MSIVVAFNPVNYENIRRREAQEVAIRVLSLSPQFVFPVAFRFKDDKPLCVLSDYGINVLPILKRDSSKVISNTRRLPYIKEILDLCSEIKCEIFGYINSDILVDTRVYYDMIQSNKDAFIFPRSDIAEISVDGFLSGDIKVIYGGDKHIGVDGFFFKKDWWVNNRHHFPEDLIIGETEWDTCYRKIIKETTNNYLEKRCLYHVYHDQKWTLNSPGALNNIKIWQEIK